MTEKALQYYKHLREQGKSASEALDHAVQRYGVARQTLMEQINGHPTKVAA